MSVHFIVKTSGGGGGGGSGPTIIQGVKENCTPASSTTMSVAFTVSVTAGNTLVATVGWDSSTGSLVQVSDNLNGNWTAAGALKQGNSCSAGIYYFHNTVGGSCTVTVTVSPGQGYLEIAVIEVKNLTGAVDAYTSGTANTASASAGNLVTTVANDLLVALCVPTTNVNSGTSGWAFTNFTTSGNGFETLIAATAGTYTPTFTLAGTGYATVAAAFKSS